MSDETFGLPRDLGDGLLLRWATSEDVEELAAFNIRIHSDSPDEPETGLGDWTRDLMNGRHPTTGPDDFTVVVDTNNGHKIISSMVLISQTWNYDGIPFGVGRPELVGTDENYRRRRLVRHQFDVIHAKSAAKGEMVQAITGIPWYYRLFGYEMGLALGGSRQLVWVRQPKPKADQQEVYQLRPATEADIPLLTELYGRHCAHSLINRTRNETLWQYEMNDPTPNSPYARQFNLIETKAGETAGYVEYNTWKATVYLRELAVLPGHSLRAIGLFLNRYLRQEADKLNPEREDQLTHISFSFGPHHPLYDALDPELEKLRPSYAWYMRVADLPGFIEHIKPVLEQRLAGSVMAGHSGTLRLNFYHSQMTLEFDKGRLSNMGAYQPKHVEDGDAFFPDLTFLQLLFGYRSLQQLREARADCFVENNDAAVLLPILFPQRPSQPVGLG
jgi:N-acetylglutamate synthase-like GNAT family acetyltransferase